MTSTNIEQFNYITGELFGLLYEHFPAYTIIDYMQLTKDEELSFASDESFEFSVVQWLEQAGYIWISEKSNTGVKATLSPKALEILNATPEKLSASIGSYSVGAALVSLVREGLQDAAKDKIKNLATWVLAQGVHYGAGFIDGGP